MELREPAGCTVLVAEGALAGATGRYVRTLGDLAGIFADRDAYEAMLATRREEVIYDVGEFRPTSAAGDMIFGVTRLSPGKVGCEFFMTKGHIHARADRPEIYYGQAGHGLMLMESPEGETRVVAVGPQAICYVPPYWIHRSVNVGADDLVMVFSYPADAGQDYDIIARAGGMRSLVVDDGASGWTLIDNPGYRPRSRAEIDRILA